MLQLKSGILQHYGPGHLFPEHPKSGVWLLAYDLLPLMVLPIRTAALVGAVNRWPEYGR
jgi:hypothetical protein